MYILFYNLYSICKTCQLSQQCFLKQSFLLISRFNPGSNWNHILSLVMKSFLNLLQSKIVLWLFSVLHELPLWKNTDQFCSGMSNLPSTHIVCLEMCLIFACDQLQFILSPSPQENHGSDARSSGNTWYVCSLLVMLILIIWLRWCLPGFSAYVIIISPFTRNSS